MWRGVVVLLLSILITTQVVTFFIDRDTHSYDTQVRAENWTAIRSNQDRILGKLDKHYDATIRVDEHLKQCSGCHSHPDTVKK